MSHTKYTTEAIILSGTDTGETDRYLKFLTRDFGVLNVHARGVRKPSSKQRTFLQVLSKSKVSLIKGRNIWRLAHVEDADEKLNIKSNVIKRNLAARISRIISRFVAGEEEGSDVYMIVESGLKCADIQRDESSIEVVENIMVLRVLYILGYVASSSELDLFFKNLQSYESEILEHARKKRALINENIYHAVEESGL